MSEEQIENDKPEQAPNRSGWLKTRSVVIIVIVAVLVVAGYFIFSPNFKAVAEVNGQVISRAAYNERYRELQAYLISNGQSATSTEAQAAIKQQAIDGLVNETLLLSLAKKEGIVAKDDEINSQITQAKAKFKDNAAFEDAIKVQGLTDSSFKDNVVKQNIIQQYLVAHLDFSSATSTDKEVTAFYQQASASGGNIPPLSQVRSQIEAQIVQQKQQQIISQYIQALRASSTVKILI